MNSKLISLTTARKKPYDYASERAQNVIGQRLLEARNGQGLSLSFRDRFVFSTETAGA